MKTDNEIIKALELCKQNTVCTGCSYISTKMGCQVGLIGDALDRINRQKAEIERLSLIIACDRATIAHVKARMKIWSSEARKEFWERLKAQNTMDERIVSVKSGDNLLAEMESEEK